MEQYGTFRHFLSLLAELWMMDGHHSTGTLKNKRTIVTYGRSDALYPVGVTLNHFKLHSHKTERNYHHPWLVPSVSSGQVIQLTSVGGTWLLQAFCHFLGQPAFKGSYL